MRVVRTDVGSCAWDAGPAEAHLSHLIPPGPTESRKKRFVRPIPPPPVPLPPEGGGGTQIAPALSPSPPWGGEGRGEVGGFFRALVAGGLR